MIDKFCCWSQNLRRKWDKDLQPTVFLSGERKSHLLKEETSLGFFLWWRCWYKPGTREFSCSVSKFLCDHAHSYKWMYKPIAKIDGSLVCFLEISKYLWKTLEIVPFSELSLVVRCVITATLHLYSRDFYSLL